MNYNILSYLLFSLISINIIIWVGRLFHQNGRVFILTFFQHKEEITDTTNNLLLVGYYLFNIGYAIIQIRFWENVNNLTAVLSSTIQNTGLLLFILAILHFNNMFIIYLISINKKLTNKKG